LFQATSPIRRRIAKDFVSGLIVPGDLPDDKIRGNSQVVSLLQATCPMVKIRGNSQVVSLFQATRKLASRLIVSGDLPNGENTDFFL
jgi:hypothetical protein